MNETTAIKVKSFVINLCKYVLLIFAAFVALVPIVSCIFTAFKTKEEYANTNVITLLRPYVAWYRQHGALLRGGDLHRLVDPEPNGLGAAWMIAARDGSEAAVFAVGDALSGAHGVASANSRPRLVLEGLDPAAQYIDEENNTYAGVQLLTTGLELPGTYGQTPAKIWYLKRV